MIPVQKLNAICAICVAETECDNARYLSQKLKVIICVCVVLVAETEGGETGARNIRQLLSLIHI